MTDKRPPDWVQLEATRITGPDPRGAYALVFPDIRAEGLNNPPTMIFQIVATVHANDTTLSYVSTAPGGWQTMVVDPTEITVRDAYGNTLTTKHRGFDAVCHEANVRHTAPALEHHGNVGVPVAASLRYRHGLTICGH